MRPKMPKLNSHLFLQTCNPPQLSKWWLLLSFWLRANTMMSSFLSTSPQTSTFRINPESDHFLGTLGKRPSSLTLMVAWTAPVLPYPSSPSYSLPSTDHLTSRAELENVKIMQGQEGGVLRAMAWLTVCRLGQCLHDCACVKVHRTVHQ